MTQIYDCYDVTYDWYDLTYIRNSRELLLFLLKKIGNARPGEGDWHPICPKTPAPTLPTNRGKEEKGKIVEDKKGESN